MAEKCAEQIEIQTKIAWYVVFFPDSNEFSVIPTNWLVKNNTQNKVIFCKWPPYKVTSDHLKNPENPTTSWRNFRIKIIGGNKIYDNFNKAWHKQVKETYSSTDTDTEKYTSKSKKRILTYSSDENNDEDANYIIMPPTQAKHTENNNAIETIPSVIPELINFGASTSVDAYNNMTKNTEKMMQYTDLMPRNTDSLNWSQNHSLEISNNLLHHDDVDGKLNNILQEQVAIKLLLNRVLSKIEAISSNDNKSLSVELIDDNFLSKFPINDTEQFYFIESCILNEFGFVSKLEYFIRNVGGNTPKSHINRVMAKLFTDKYGIKCTWTGRGKNIITKIGDSELIKTMKKSIQESYKNNSITDSEFQNAVSEWLRHANTRYCRSNNSLNIN